MKWQLGGSSSNQTSFNSIFSPTIEKLDEASFDVDENIGHCLLCNGEYYITSRDGVYLPPRTLIQIFVTVQFDLDMSWE